MIIIIVDGDSLAKYRVLFVLRQRQFADFLHHPRTQRNRESIVDDCSCCVILTKFCRIHINIISLRQQQKQNQQLLRSTSTTIAEN